jgi:predicted 3-demethylubiquinone-9 3-methyltransferase (glyoxalase superfamily)
VKQPRIVPNLWFDTEAEEAAKFYVSVFKNSRVVSRTHYTEGAPREAGMVMTVEFELDGQRFVGINGGPQFKFDEAVSFQITCKDQDEVDYYWERLTSGGGLEGPCGWCKDKFGLSWQVVPSGMDVILSDPDSERAQRAMEAMLKMRKLDIAELERAAAGPDEPADEPDEETEDETEDETGADSDDEPSASGDDEPQDEEAADEEEKATA